MRGTLPTALALALLAGLSAPARAEVDIEVPATFKAKGALAPAEQETFRFRAEKGTALTLAATPAKKSGLLLDVQLFNTGGAVTIPDGFVTVAAGKVSWKAFPVPASDDYRIVLSGAGSGGYSLSLKAKVQAAWIENLTFAGAPTVHFLFSAPAGSLLFLSAKPAKGSPVVARFGDLDSALSSTDLSMTGKVTPTSHLTIVGPLEDGGDYDLTVANTGTPGDVVVLAKVKAPKVKPGKLDLRGVALGKPAGGETLVGRMLDAAGGSVAVGDGANELFGAEVVLPAGALGGPTLVSIASSLPPSIPDPDDQAAGPAVLLGPSGTTFGAPAVVTLPVDPYRIPADATIDDVRVLIVEDNGTSRIVVPTGVSAGTVTLETTGFSVCCPIIVSGPPALGVAPGGDEFWFLQFNAEFDDESPGGRGRSIDANVGVLSFFGDGTMQVSQTHWGYQWQNYDSPPMSGNPIASGLAEVTEGENITLDWAYDISRRFILLSGIPEVLPTLRVSRDGRYLAGRKDGFTDTFAEVQFGVRKNTAPITAASVQGTWTVTFLEMDVGNTSSTGAAEPRTARGTATFVFDGTAACSISLSQRQPAFNAANGSFTHPSESFSVQGTYAVDPDGTIAITIPENEDGEDGGILRVYPGAGLEVMLLTHDDFVDDAALGGVLVRQGSGLSKASLVGDFHGSQFAVDPNSYPTPGGGPYPSVNIADFSTQDQGVTGTFDGGATASFSFDTHHVRRDGSQPTGVLVENDTEDITVNVTVTSQGKVTLGDSEGKVVGAISPDAQFLVAVTDLGNPAGDYAMYFLFRSPPDKTP